MNPPKPNFKPLVSTAERQRIFGKFDYRAVAGSDDIVILGNWERENIIRVHIPQLTGVGGGLVPKNLSIPFHKLAANQLQALFREWEDAGLIKHILTYAGSFVPRFVRGSRSTLSNHAFGTAFDINAAWNGLGRVPAKAGTTGSVRELVAIAHKHGFYWGGHFSRPDGMHFEVAVLQPGSPAVTPVTVYKNIRPMMRGEMVTRIQLVCRDNGCDPKGIDGIFGGDTESAVKCYQKKFGLKVDGMAGPETLGHMKLTTDN